MAIILLPSSLRNLVSLQGGPDLPLGSKSPFLKNIRNEPSGKWGERCIFKGKAIYFW
jgi:hypothetical protein